MWLLSKTVGTFSFSFDACDYFGVCSSYAKANWMYTFKYYQCRKWNVVAHIVEIVNFQCVKDVLLFFTLFFGQMGNIKTNLCRNEYFAAFIVIFEGSHCIQSLGSISPKNSEQCFWLRRCLCMNYCFNGLRVISMTWRWKCKLPFTCHFFSSAFL